MASPWSLTRRVASSPATRSLFVASRARLGARRTPRGVRAPSRRAIRASPRAALSGKASDEAAPSDSARRRRDDGASPPAGPSAAAGSPPPLAGDVASREDAASSSPPPSASTLPPAATPPPSMGDDAPKGFIPSLERAINALVVRSAVFVIDALYQSRPYARFYALETVARVPYFSFLSVLHLYETLGLWRRADYLKVHFAQTLNEFHHLLIMESMGGDEKFEDRFFAQHMAVAYYFIACGMYALSPRMAYNLSEQVEAHAFHTYDEFLRENERELKNTPPPPIAVHYYTEGDLFLFDEFQTGERPRGDDGAGGEGGAEGGSSRARRRPSVRTLYDVFACVRDDEAEHMKTMQFCQLPGTIMRSPSEAAACVVAETGGAERETAVGGGEAAEGELGEAKAFEIPCAADAYADAMDRTCEGLIECLFRGDDEDERPGGETLGTGEGGEKTPGVDEGALDPGAAKGEKTGPR